MTKPVLLTTSEVAAQRGITVRQVQRLAQAGLLPVHSVGPRNKQFFRVSDARRSPTSLA